MFAIVESGLPTIGCDKYKYFFYRRQYLDERIQLYKRGTKTGYWKSTGKPRQINGRGKKRSLVFYKKSCTRGSKPVRTGWIMQEYNDGVSSKLMIKFYLLNFFFYATFVS